MTRQSGSMRCRNCLWHSVGSCDREQDFAADLVDGSMKTLQFQLGRADSGVTSGIQTPGVPHSPRTGGIARLALGVTTGLALAAVFADAIVRGTPSNAQTAVASASLSHQPAHALTGVTSCAAYACHGGNGPLGDDRSAYTIWMASDLHSKAGAVLREPDAHDMAARLAGKSGGKPIAPEADPRCLACHVSPAVEPPAQSHASIRDGVSCESCHGPAGDWLDAHTLPSWKQLSDDEKRQRGMSFMKNPVDRARTCVPCHIGGPGRDVDHDLIAAGHPRLNFEYMSYLEAMPRHWTESSRETATADADVRAWAYGQAITAQASLALLADRAREAANHDPKQPRTRTWPEFAEYDCDSCHHDLSEPSWASRRGLSGMPPRLLAWNDGALSLASALAEQGGTNKLQNDGSALAELRKLMTNPEPDPRLVERLAGKVVIQLNDRVAVDLTTTTDDLARVLRARSSRPHAHEASSRDRLEQLYTAVEILARARERTGRPLDPSLLGKLRRLHARLNGPGEQRAASSEWNALLAEILEKSGVPDLSPENQRPK